MTFTDRFKYLGSTVDESLSDDEEVSRRIKAASGAFGAMRKQVFESKHISYQTKKVVYVTLIINILLYGAECWCLTETLLHQLRSFHHHCIRVMCGVTRWHVWRHHIRNAELRKRLRLETLDFYVELRQLPLGGPCCSYGLRTDPAQVHHLMGLQPAASRASPVHVRTFVEQDAQTRGFADRIQEVERAGAES